VCAGKKKKKRDLLNDRFRIEGSMIVQKKSCGSARSGEKGRGE